MHCLFSSSHHGAVLLGRSLGQNATASAFKVLELEDAGIVLRQVLHGVPGRGAETLQASVTLEPETRRTVTGAVQTFLTLLCAAAGLT